MVLIGLFTQRVPALGAKIAIIFHVIAYATLQFILEVEINFIHIYAILFFIEVGIMLLVGYLKPTESDWTYDNEAQVSLVPWRYAYPASFVLLAGIALSYVLFSPIGLVGGISEYFWISVTAIAVLTAVASWLSLKRYDAKSQ